MEIELVEQQSRPVLSIRMKTTLAGLPNIIGDSYHRIADYLAELGEQPADVPFTAYYNTDMQNLDIELGFTVGKPLVGKGDITAGKTAGGKAALCMYKGPYSGMETVYNEIFKWITENGHQPKGVFYEYYYNSPGEVPESELLTRIVIPLK
jgi:effector-binding domain-containing protein